MPWPSNHLPKYRKHKASGQAVVTLNGVEHYLGPHGTKASKTHYDRLIAEWLKCDRRLQPTGGDSITVVELCARYLRFATDYYRTTEIYAERDLDKGLEVARRIG